MIATYHGKVVIQDGQEDPMCCTLSQESLDEKIAEGALWGSLDNLEGLYVRLICHDDGTPVSEEDMISISEVPADADLFITTEIAFEIS